MSPITVVCVQLVFQTKGHCTLGSSSRLLTTYWNTKNPVQTVVVQDYFSKVSYNQVNFIISLSLSYLCPLFSTTKHQTQIGAKINIGLAWPRPGSRRSVIFSYNTFLQRAHSCEKVSKKDSVKTPFRRDSPELPMPRRHRQAKLRMCSLDFQSMPLRGWSRGNTIGLAGSSLYLTPQRQDKTFVFDIRPDFKLCRTSVRDPLAETKQIFRETNNIRFKSIRKPLA